MGRYNITRFTHPISVHENKTPVQEDPKLGEFGGRLYQDRGFTGF